MPSRTAQRYPPTTRVLPGDRLLASPFIPDYKGDATGDIARKDPSAMSDPLPTRPGRAENGAHFGRVIGLGTVCVGFTALAAATFVLSYSGLHAFVLQAGVTGRLARGYPFLVDAMLVIAAAAVIWLRAAGLPSRLLAWLSLLAVLAAAATADALHAAGDRLPDSYAPIIAAVVPWALVFIGFMLLLAMLRHARLRLLAGHAAADGSGRWPGEALQFREPGMSGHVATRADAAPSIVPGLERQRAVQPQPLTVPSQAGRVSFEGADDDTDPGTGTAAAGEYYSVATAASAGARAAQATDADVSDVDPPPDDPGDDGSAYDPADGTAAYPADADSLAMSEEPGSPDAVADATLSDGS